MLVACCLCACAWVQTWLPSHDGVLGGGFELAGWACVLPRKMRWKGFGVRVAVALPRDEVGQKITKGLFMDTQRNSYMQVGAGTGKLHIWSRRLPMLCEAHGISQEDAERLVLLVSSAERVVAGMAHAARRRIPVVEFRTGAVQVILPSRFSLHTEDGTCPGVRTSNAFVVVIRFYDHASAKVDVAEGSCCDSIKALRSMV
eukprot:251961-Chlamydomonas_euryale.AAC.1